MSQRTVPKHLTPEILRSERLVRRLRQVDLAAAVGCSRHTIDMAERGRRWPSAAMLARIRAALARTPGSARRPGPRVRV